MTEKPSVLRADARRNYNLLLQTAEKAFLRNGAGVALETIAQQAHVGIGTLYRHFPNRESLLQAVYAPKITELTTKAASLLTAVAPDQAFLAWLRMVANFSAQYNGFSSVISLASVQKDSPLAHAGLELLDAAQKTQIIRDDVTITDILKLVSGATVGMTKDGTHRTDILIEIIFAGLKRSTP